MQSTCPLCGEPASRVIEMGYDKKGEPILQTIPHKVGSEECLARQRMNIVSKHPTIPMILISSVLGGVMAFHFASVSECISAGAFGILFVMSLMFAYRK